MDQSIQVGNIDAMNAAFDKQRNAVIKNSPPDYAQRKAHLVKLSKMISTNRKLISDTISKDFGNRPGHETEIAEIIGSLGSIKYAISHLKKWMKPQSRSTSIWFLPGSNKVIHQPRGVVGIMSPWNYPLHLAISPLAAALAAGNRVMIKMSEVVPNTSALIKRLISESFPEDVITVVEGGADVAQAFSSLAFDHLLFTGSTEVGRMVMAAASKNLTPVTLELSGKSPVIVTPGYSVKEAATRIMWGKLFNAGQTCVAPDYAFIPHDKLDVFVAAAQAYVTRHYPKLENDKNYTSIINEGHYRRLSDLVEDAEAKGAQIIQFGETTRTSPPDTRKFPATIIVNPTDDMAVMNKEIFGPILPIMTYGKLDEVVRYVNRKSSPLALYVFGNKIRQIDAILKDIPAGGVTVNDTLLHYLQDDLPFGGVGASGMGKYHGREGFETFSNKKAVFTQRGFGSFTGTKLLYPPYGKMANLLLKLMSY